MFCLKSEIHPFLVLVPPFSCYPPCTLELQRPISDLRLYPWSWLFSPIRKSLNAGDILMLDVKFLNLSIHHTVDECLADELIYLTAMMLVVLSPYEVRCRGTVKYTQCIIFLNRFTPVAKPSRCCGKRSMIRKTCLDGICDGEQETTFPCHVSLNFCLIGCQRWSSPEFRFIYQCAVFESDRSQCFHIFLGRNAETVFTLPFNDSHSIEEVTNFPKPALEVEKVPSRERRRVNQSVSNQCFPISFECITHRCFDYLSR